MNQDPEDQERDKQGRVIRRPEHKFDPWKGVLNRSIPKLGPNEVFEDDDFTPPLPSPAQVQQMKQRDVLTRFRDASPKGNLLRYLMDVEIKMRDDGDPHLRRHEGDKGIPPKLDGPRMEAFLEQLRSTFGGNA